MAWDARHLDRFVPRDDAKRAWGRSPDKYVSVSLRVGLPLRAGLSLRVIASEARQSSRPDSEPASRRTVASRH